MDSTQGFKRKGTYGKADHVQTLVTEWAKTRGWRNAGGFVLFGKKGVPKPTFAFVEEGPDFVARVLLAKTLSLPFYIVTADSFDGKWTWKHIASGKTFTGTRRDFQRFLTPLEPNGVIAEDMRRELLADKRRWTDLAIREIGHTKELNKVDVDSIVVTADFKRVLAVVEGQFYYKDLPWTITRTFGYELRVPSCCIRCDDAPRFAIETYPHAGFTSLM
jgi:hypothetical protein